MCRYGLPHDRHRASDEVRFVRAKVFLGRHHRVLLNGLHVDELDDRLHPPRVFVRINIHIHSTYANTHKHDMNSLDNLITRIKCKTGVGRRVRLHASR